MARLGPSDSARPPGSLGRRAGGSGRGSSRRHLGLGARVAFDLAEGGFGRGANMTPSYQSLTVLGMAIDPIHVGTGGARLGRVDLSIVRDPVTRVPKIPGSSLAGVCRAYAAMGQQANHPERKVNDKIKPYYPDCAGQGQPKQDRQG